MTMITFGSEHTPIFREHRVGAMNWVNLSAAFEDFEVNIVLLHWQPTLTQT